MRIYKAVRVNSGYAHSKSGCITRKMELNNIGNYLPIRIAPTTTNNIPIQFRNERFSFKKITPKNATKTILIFSTGTTCETAPIFNARKYDIHDTVVAIADKARNSQVRIVQVPEFFH
jgi:hypothetical protein